MDAGLPRFFTRVSWAFLSLSLAIAMLGFAGWILGAPGLQSLIPGNPRMVPFTALALILAGMSQAFLRSGSVAAARAGGAIVILLVITAALRKFGIDLLPTEIFAPADGGSVSPLTLLCLALNAVAEILLSREKAKTAWTAQALSLFAMALSGCNLLLYFCGFAWQAAIHYNSMAASTSLAIFSLALSTMISKPYTGIMVLLTTRSLDGGIARRFLGATLAFPLLAGWAAIFVQGLGLADVTVASTALVCFTVAFFSGVLWITAAQVHRLSLDREQAFLRVNNLSEEAKLRDDFVAMLSHDLRSPLTAAKLATELALRAKGRPEIAERNMERARNGIARVDAMIRDLLDASRIRAGQPLPLDIGECDLNEIVESTADQLRFIYPKREIHTESVEKITGRWSCDGLRRILENLVTNALKYGDPEKPVSIRYWKQGAFVEIAVRNWGAVISRERLDKFFMPYQRDAAVEARQPGWGLGLALVRGLTEAQGGRVSATSSAEAGTVFRILLPTV